MATFLLNVMEAQLPNDYNEDEIHLDYEDICMKSKMIYEGESKK